MGKKEEAKKAPAAPPANAAPKKPDPKPAAAPGGMSWAGLIRKVATSPPPAPEAKEAAPEQQAVSTKEVAKPKPTGPPKPEELPSLGGAAAPVAPASKVWGPKARDIIAAPPPAPAPAQPAQEQEVRPPTPPPPEPQNFKIVEAKQKKQKKGRHLTKDPGDAADETHEEPQQEESAPEQRQDEEVVEPAAPEAAPAPEVEKTPVQAPAEPQVEESPAPVPVLEVAQLQTHHQPAHPSPAKAVPSPQRDRNHHHQERHVKSPQHDHSPEQDAVVVPTQKKDTVYVAPVSPPSAPVQPKKSTQSWADDAWTPVGNDEPEIPIPTYTQESLQSGQTIAASAPSMDGRDDLAGRQLILPAHISSNGNYIRFAAPNAPFFAPPSPKVSRSEITAIENELRVTIRRELTNELEIERRRLHAERAKLDDERRALERDRQNLTIARSTIEQNQRKLETERAQLADEKLQHDQVVQKLKTSLSTIQSIETSTPAPAVVPNAGGYRHGQEFQPRAANPNSSGNFGHAPNRNPPHRSNPSTMQPWNQGGYTEENSYDSFNPTNRLPSGGYGSGGAGMDPSYGAPGYLQNTNGGGSMPFGMAPQVGYPPNPSSRMQGGGMNGQGMNNAHYGAPAIGVGFPARSNNRGMGRGTGGMGSGGPNGGHGEGW
jgi:hypothetical protein